MKKLRLTGASALIALLAAILAPAPSASAVKVECGDPNFVQVAWHPSNGVGGVACFAGAGKNWFEGVRGFSSWATYLITGNNDITFVDCNGTTIDYPRGKNTPLNPAKCVAWINIKPY
ncbi:hypothetical protein GCM10010178_85100 [Lentzea flava]|uniref:Streptomyces killer toxin-like beta/gamma crystallin domain-containing protein n=2 Tax=Lentzea flava TaxID=103732 RepID=A0ABQ2VES3_9PSEU|nr:Beta/Gamma crystallin [Lentzea flava]GGU81413.1 hypothetical protein GCM10010178_85100 [Lentzea flava]